jgi:hypothetical protein
MISEIIFGFVDNYGNFIQNFANKLNRWCMHLQVHGHKKKKTQPDSTNYICINMTWKQEDFEVDDKSFI